MWLAQTNLLVDVSKVYTYLNQEVYLTVPCAASKAKMLSKKGYDEIGRNVEIYHIDGIMRKDLKFSHDTGVNFDYMRIITPEVKEILTAAFWAAESEGNEEVDLDTDTILNKFSESISTEENDLFDRDIAEDFLYQQVGKF